MVDSPPVLPLVVDESNSFAIMQALNLANDDVVFGQQSDTILGGVITAEPARETAAPDSECSSILSHEGVYIAATPVAYISGLRYKRREILDYGKITPVDQIGPQNSDVEERKLPSNCKWVPHVHPEGSVYFQQENWFTNAWLYDKQNLRDIDAALHLVSLEFRRRGLATNRYEICLDIDSEDDEELDNGVKLGCYYVCDKVTEEVFWFQEIQSTFFYDGLDVKILSREHLRHAGGIGYWDHLYMFPHGRSLTVEQLHVLRADLTYHSFDKKTSKSSTAPYNKDDLKDLLDILKEIEALVKEDQIIHPQQEVAVTRPQHIVVVSRLRQTLCRERFMRLHGERYAQLDSDRSVYENTHRERSLLFHILTWIFFFTPPIYFEHLSRIWVDKKINYDRWRSFIGDLQDDWMASITPSAVILTANVGFLAIQSVDGNGTSTPDRSMGQIVSYMSTLFSISNIVACTALTWQHRRSEHHYAEDAVKYLVARASSRFGMEKLAIIFSIPTTLFLFALLTFFIAISWVCLQATDTSTRVVIAITMFMITGLLSIIAHNWKWQTAHDVNSLAENMTRMKKRVKEARRRSAQRWKTFSGTLVSSWPVSVWPKRKSTKQSLRSSRAGPRNSMETSLESISTSNPPQRDEVSNASIDSPTRPPGLPVPIFEDIVPL